MTGWTKHTGRAVVLPLDNIDTDQLIPARFMSTPRSEGYGGFLLHDMRRLESGALRQDFPLNNDPLASVLVTGLNFGIGSSREAAVYALVDAGFRVVVAPSFGDIFAANAVNNGLLPASVSMEVHASLLNALPGLTEPIAVDLDTMLITGPDIEAKFSLDETWRTKLINGWDDIDLTRQHRGEIARFRHMRIQTAAWAWPALAD